MIFERNHIYHMDCIEGLKEMLRGGVKVDCIITDPPYLINYKTNNRKDKTHRFCKPIQNDNNPQLIIDLMPLLYEVLKDNAPLYMFCGSDKIDFFKQQVEKYFTIKNIIVWDKGNQTMGDLEAQFGKGYEFIIYANKGRAIFNPNAKRYSDVWRFNRVSSDKLIHQNQKPLDVLSRMINQHTKQDDLILDPFMGSCATAVAAHKLQRDYIGFEIDDYYYKVGTDWLNSECNQINIFEIMEEKDETRKN